MANIKRPFWLLEWLMLLLDLLGVPELIQFIHRILNWRQRKLNTREKTIANTIFQHSIQWDNIRLNDTSLLCKKYNFAFVGFHTIHFSETISDDIFIHELVHVWQYERYGSAYIVRALHAQSSEMGYKYGGVLALQKKNHLEDFNFEQMAEVVRDGYLQAGRATVFDKYLRQLLE